MRFKIGSMVEVLSNKDLSDVWRCAKIVADDGDGYTVKYYRGPGIAKNGVDKVPTKSVRPCPKPATGSDKWAAGDVVEVLDDGYWRVSVIEEVLEDDYYQIRVIGSLDEFMAHNTSIRARQVWTENKWVLKDKDLTSRMHNKACVQSQFSGTKVQGIPGSGLLSNALKRSSPDHPSTDDAHSGCVQKRRFLDDACSFVGKIDHPTKETTGTNKVSSRNHDDFKFFAKTADADDSVSIASSVASCSVTNVNYDRLLSHSAAESRQDSDSLCSDADSPSSCREEEEISDGGQLKREDPLKTHELDLHGYRCVLESLYKSGPLTWQQELALTNLRMKLYVSNDEHLTELRRLKSMGGLGLRCH